MLAWFQTIGAAFGILSAVLLLWDRLVKHRPFVRLKARSLIEGTGSPGYLFAEVINPGPLPIIVRSQNDPKRLQAAMDNRALSQILTHTGTQFSVSIEAGGKWEFAIHLPSDFEQMPNDQRLWLRFKWWPVQSLLPFGWPLATSAPRHRLQTLIAPTVHYETGPIPTPEQMERRGVE